MQTGIACIQLGLFPLRALYPEFMSRSSSYLIRVLVQRSLYMFSVPCLCLSKPGHGSSVVTTCMHNLHCISFRFLFGLQLYEPIALLLEFFILQRIFKVNCPMSGAKTYDDLLLFFLHFLFNILRQTLPIWLTKSAM